MVHGHDIALRYFFDLRMSRYDDLIVALYYGTFGYD